MTTSSYMPDQWQFWAHLGGGEAVLREHQSLVQKEKLALLREVQAAIIAEHLSDETGDPSDQAYDEAVSHCNAVVQAIIDRVTGDPRPISDAAATGERPS